MNSVTVSNFSFMAKLGGTKKVFIDQESLKTSIK